ncbi:MAG: hypothetical protein JXA30_19555 [Deltaproteobacteria bacterium]|nr:hypothetical protein [Deltaproteobacteria bacterium]
MKAQISRDSFQEEKTYSGVYQQQGRMLTDADWNEMVRILKHRMDKTVGASIDSGSPRDGGILYEEPLADTKSKVSSLNVAANIPLANALGELAGRPDKDTNSDQNPLPIQPIDQLPEDPYERFNAEPRFKWGRVYADGLYGEIAPKKGAPFAKNDPLNIADLIVFQRDFPDFPINKISEGIVYAVYVDLWERLVIAQEDARLLDAALHGADTCVRTQTMAQVKLCLKNELAKTLTYTCGDASLYTNKIASGVSDGNFTEVAPILSASGGNALFRLEVHDVQKQKNGSLQVTLKWSFENGAVILDKYFKSDPHFDTDHKYEIVTLTSEKHLGYHNLDGRLIIDNVTGELWSKKTGELKSHQDLINANISLDDDTFIRRWDEYFVIELDTAKRWKAKTKEGSVGIRDNKFIIRLQAGSSQFEVTLDLKQTTVFIPGDYWLVLLRNSGSGLVVESLSEKPVGIHHHYLVLGKLTKETVVFPKGSTTSLSTIKFELEDNAQWRQLTFPSLTRLTLDRVLIDDNNGNEISIVDKFVDVEGDTMTGDLNIRESLFVDKRVGVGFDRPNAQVAIAGGVHIGGESDPGAKNLQVDGKIIAGSLTVTGDVSGPFDRTSTGVVNFLAVRTTTALNSGWINTGRLASGLCILLGEESNNSIKIVDYNWFPTINDGLESPKREVRYRALLREGANEKGEIQIWIQRLQVGDARDFRIRWWAVEPSESLPDEAVNIPEEDFIIDICPKIVLLGTYMYSDNSSDPERQTWTRQFTGLNEQQFIATVDNSPDTGVTWDNSDCRFGTISKSGLFKVTHFVEISYMETIITVTKSVANTSKSASATVVLFPEINLSMANKELVVTYIAPTGNFAIITEEIKILKFDAPETVINHGVRWKLESNSGLVDSGSLEENGDSVIYKTPSSWPDNCLDETYKFTVTATSKYDDNLWSSVIFTVSFQMPV